MSAYTPNEHTMLHYIQRKLSPQDEEQFELWLADHPEALAELELDTLIQESFATRARTKKPEVVPESVSKWPQWLGPPLLTAVCAVALMVGGGVLTSLYVSKIAENRALAKATSKIQPFTLYNQRSNTIEPFEFRVRSDVEWLVIAVDVGVADRDSLTIRIEDQLSAEPAIEINNISVDFDGRAEVLIRRDSMPNAAYRLRALYEEKELASFDILITVI